MVCNMFSSWIRSGLRVLAAHDQALWGLGSVVVDGGRERPDARWGAVWRAAPGERGFCNRWLFLSVRSIKVGTRFNFEVDGARVVGGKNFKTLKAAPCCGYRLVSLRIQ